MLDTSRYVYRICRFVRLISISNFMRQIFFTHWFCIFTELCQDVVGRDGFGGLDPSWESASLSTYCPSLTSVTIILYVEPEYGSHGANTWWRKNTILTWRYALRLLSSASPRLKSITISLAFSVNSVDNYFTESTIQFVDWKKWDDVLRKFEDLEELRFIRLSEHLWVYTNNDQFAPGKPLPKSICSGLRSLSTPHFRSLFDRGIVRFD